MRHITVFLHFALALPAVLSWSPISSPLKGFSLTQSLPAFGASSPIDQHASQSIRPAQGRQTTSTFFGKKVLNLEDNSSQQFGSSFDGTSSFGDDDLLRPTHGFFGEKIHNGFLANQEHCPVEKYAIQDDGVVEYHAQIPELDQLTVCGWTRFTNHSGDHVIFTYASSKEDREIQFWVANSGNSSFWQMAIHGQSLFRLNYPIKLYQWHHFCSSWNGKTGEWQLWVKAERVGRGFHNRLVNHLLAPHGVAFSGGPSITGEPAPGHHFEVTMIQLYKVALSAGKAHRDHKHHHVHHFDHNGPIELARATTTQAPPTPPSRQANHPLLMNGQLIGRVLVTQNQPAQAVPAQPGQPQSPQQPGQVVTFPIPVANGQPNFGVQSLAQNILTNFPQQATLQQQGGAAPQSGQFLQISQPSSSSPGQLQFSQQPQRTSSPFRLSSTGPSSSQIIYNSINNSPANVRFIDDSSFVRLKRQSGRQNGQRQLRKRGLILQKDGSIVDDTLVNLPNFFDGLTQFGLESFKEDQIEHTKEGDELEEEIREHDREPAEGEVQAVMSLCSKCQVEPFKGALVMGWRDIKTTSQYALKALSTGSCGEF